MEILNQGVSLEEALIYGPSRLDFIGDLFAKLNIVHSSKRLK